MISYYTQKTPASEGGSDTISSTPASEFGRSVFSSTSASFINLTDPSAPPKAIIFVLDEMSVSRIERGNP